MRIRTRTCGKRALICRVASHAAQAGHLDVQQGHVGPQLLDQLQGLVAIRRFAHHLDIVGALQELADALAHQGVVVGQDHADLVRHVGLHI